LLAFTHMATTDAAAGAEIQLKPARTSMAAPRGPTGPPRLATVVDREKVIIHMHYYPPTHSRYLARSFRLCSKVLWAIVKVDPATK
jgi:hypothetical protein